MWYSVLESGTQIVCDRISSVQFFGVRTNVLCALKKFTVWHFCRLAAADAAILYLYVPHSLLFASSDVKSLSTIFGSFRGV